MEIRALKPGSGVSTPQPVAREPVVVASNVQAVPAVARTQPERPVVRDLQHTRAAVAEVVGEYLRTSDRDLEFRVDTGTKATVITVRDASGEVIRQIPNETALRLMRLLNAESGTLVDKTA